jgi:hypothetical protein
MNKKLSLFASMFEADTGMDVRDEFVSAWADALVQKNSQRNRKFVATDVDNWLKTMHEEVAECDKSATVRVWLDELNDLFCVSVVDASGCSEFCVAPPRNPKTDTEKLILAVINGGPEAQEAFRGAVLKLKGDSPAETVSDKREERLADSVVVDDDDMSDDELDELADKLDKTASLLANNQSAAYMVELAASRLREIKAGE